MRDTLVQSVRFDERGLIPAILQDASNREILGLCYLDYASLEQTLRVGRAEFASPDSMGHRLVDVKLNTDGASLTVLLERDETDSMRGTPPSLTKETPSPGKAQPAELTLVDVASMEFGLGLNKLYGLIAERKKNRPEGSYTSYLFNKGLDKILKKIAEESGEVIIAAKNKSPGEIVSELADLFYHLLVLMVDREVKLADVNDELSRRANQAPTKAGAKDDGSRGTREV